MLMVDLLSLNELSDERGRWWRRTSGVLGQTSRSAGRGLRDELVRQEPPHAREHAGRASPLRRLAVTGNEALLELTVVRQEKAQRLVEIDDALARRHPERDTSEVDPPQPIAGGAALVPHVGRVG